VERPHRTWYLEAATELVPGGIVVTARGRIGSVSAARFATVVSAARTDSGSLVIDLADVDYISGAGVAVLKEAARNGTRMILCGLREPVRITLELAQVLDGLTVMADRQAAIESLIPDS
jgi:anti-anti-sigma factor